MGPYHYRRVSPSAVAGDVAHGSGSVLVGRPITSQRRAILYFSSLLTIASFRGLPSRGPTRKFSSSRSATPTTTDTRPPPAISLSPPAHHTHTASHTKQNTMASAVAIGAGVAVAAFLVCDWPLSFERAKMPDTALFFFLFFFFFCFLANTHTGPCRTGRPPAVARRRGLARQSLLQGRLREQDDKKGGDADPLAQVGFLS